MKRILLLVATVATVFSFAGSAGAVDAPSAYHESFDSYDAAAWTPWFAQNASNAGPDMGTLTSANGRVTVAPSYYRGGASLQSTGHVVKALPAHVSFTILAPGTGYRAVNVMLMPSFYAFYGQQAWVSLQLGNTNHVYSSFRTVISDANGIYTMAQPAAVPVFPSNVPMTGELTLTATSAELEFNGQHMLAQGDVASVFNVANGLNFEVESWDDYGMGGVALDELTVTYSADSTLPPAPPQIHKGTAVFNPRTLNLQSRGNNFMASVDLGAVEASAVKTGTVFLKAGSTNVAATSFTVSDSDNDGVGEMRAVFDRAQVCAALAGSTGSVQLKVVGDLEDGSTFAASGYLTVVQSTTSSARAVWTRWRALR